MTDKNSDDDSVIAVLISVFAAVLIGVIASFAAVAFFDIAGSIRGFFGVSSDGYNIWTLTLMPIVAGIICACFKLYIRVPFCGLADTMFAAAHGGSQPWRQSLASAAASFVSFCGGASVGQYGPVGHLGGFIGGLFRRHYSPGIGAACGVAAAIAAAFNAPLTGLVFAHEVILRRYSARNVAPVAISAVIGYMISAGVLSRPAFLSIGDMQNVKLSYFVLFGVQGIIFGFLAALYLRAIFTVSRRTSHLPCLPLFAAVGGICGLLWFSLPLASGGRELLNIAAVGEFDGGWQQALSIGAVKAAATILCLGVGFAGGVVSPTLIVGGLVGALCGTAATALGIYDGPMFAPVLCGMISFTAPTIGAPLAGVLFVLEISGGNYPLTAAATLAVALSAAAFSTCGRGSYYEQQLQLRGVDIGMVGKKTIVPEDR